MGVDLRIYKLENSNLWELPKDEWEVIRYPTDHLFYLRSNVKSAKDYLSEREVQNLMKLQEEFIDLGIQDNNEEAKNAMRVLELAPKCLRPVDVERERKDMQKIIPKESQHRYEYLLDLLAEKTNYFLFRDL